MSEVKCVWQIDATLGEGPLWVERENAVYWVDIYKQQVHRLSLSDGAKKSWSFDTQVTCLAEREQGGFAGTIRDGFAYINLATSSYEPIVLPEEGIPGNRFNDGKVDKFGRFWGGTMHNKGQLESGALYRLDGDLNLKKMDDNYIIDNGPAFSADGATMYHTDSAKRVVYAFDCTEQGEISNKRKFIQLEDKAEGSPDGMTVDSEDCIWLAHFGGARITRYSPKGEVIKVIPMPAPNITSCTFAGANLDTLYITSARIHMTEEALAAFPLAGSLFSIKPGVRGLPTPKFAG